MKILHCVAALCLLLGGLSIQAEESTSVDLAIEEAVLAEATRNWEAARAADLSAMLEPLLSTDKGAYVAQSEVWWSREDTVAFYDAAFEGVARQDIEWERETVTVLSPTSALYVGKGIYRQYDSSNQMLVESPHAVSMVFVLIDGRWRMRHLHQSFPGGE